MRGRTPTPRVGSTLPGALPGTPGTASPRMRPDQVPPHAAAPQPAFAFTQ
ncbi:hypothetical protein ACFOPN_06320 [Xanthomonas hyacinthi]